jgi:NADPH:quinone reductase-like Zn-dependent oxidoreductase
MKAAVVTTFDAPPRYLDYPDPGPARDPGQAVVDVLAAGLHPRVRSAADGSHYTSTGVLPLVPGIDAMLTARQDRSRPLTWIEIGSVAGADAAIPSAALRSARLQIVGSGIGSVPDRDFAEEIPQIAAAVAEGAFDVRARAVPLAEVEQAWTAAATSDRIVLVP